jgi:hypothetical protein
MTRIRTLKTQRTQFSAAFVGAINVGGRNVIAFLDI